MPVTNQKRESIAQSCYWTALAACLAVPTILSIPAASAAADVLQRELERVSPPTAPALIKPGKVTAPAKPSVTEIAPGPSGGPRFAIGRYDVKGNTILSQAEVDKLLASFTGQDKDFSDVQRALEALQQAYIDAGFGVVQVNLPEQELEAGVVQFRVMEARLGKIMVEGNQFFSSENVRSSLPALHSGEAPDTRRIASNLRVINENPAKQTNVLLKSSEDEEGVIDATIRVADQKPWRFAITLDNTGSPDPAESRMGFSYQHANLFNRDHVLNLQYITSPEDIRAVTIFGLGYHIPMYEWVGSFDFFAGSADVDSGQVSDIFTVSGKGTVFGARYNQMLPKFGNYEHRLSGGLDYRTYENNVTFGSGSPSLVPDITIHPASLTYSGQLAALGRQTNFYLTAVQNLYPHGSDANQKAFDAVRFDADARYFIYRFGMTHAIALPKDWQMRFSANGQYTTDALVPGEQFGIGGEDSVRGFFERQFANDIGRRLSLEFFTPEFGPRIDPKLKARGVFFYDMANIHRNDALPGEQTNLGIGSVGTGVRMGFGKNVSLRLDYGVVVDGAEDALGNTIREDGDVRFHANIGIVF